MGRVSQKQIIPKFDCILGRFCSARPAVQAKEDCQSTTLEFVKINKNLKQIFKREPEDGFYPRVKAIHELIPADIPELTKLSKWETISKLIEE